MADYESNVILTVNGKLGEFPRCASLQDLLPLLSPPTVFAVAINESFVPKSLYAETPVRGGDRIEIVTPQAGG